MTGSLAVVVLVVILSLTTLGGNLTYYYYPTEAIDNRSELPDGKRFRLAGLVVQGSLSEIGDEYRFEVSDGGAVIPVLLVNSPPALFKESVPVLLDGAFHGNSFVADSALIRHDENYSIPEEGGEFQSG